MESLTQFAQSMDWAGMADFLMRAAAVLLCLTVHETCHGLAAYALGDPTAKRERRLSLNPLRHLDLFGTLMMLVAGFGWAKPVPVDMRYFKHPKSGMALTALAGPASNFVLAYTALLVRAVLYPFYQGGSGAAAAAVGFCTTLAALSIGLGIFNLLPIPPLDGSKVLEGVLPDRIYYTILRYERLGMGVLVVLLWTGVVNRPLRLVQSWVLSGMVNGTVWLFRLVSNLL